MNLKIVKRISIVVLVVCLAAAMFVLPTSCGGGEADAIIILPGIMGSNIIDADSGDPLWAPIERGVNLWELNGVDDYLGLIDQPGIQALLDFDGDGGAYEWLDKMTISKDGKSNPKYNISAQVIDENGKSKFPKASKYGTLEYYKTTYNYFKDNFGDKYDVRMFEYDWRLDNSVNAERLEQFLKDNKYDKVILVGHSMGGVLASTFIARGNNAKKVDKFISLGAPFFGAHKALRVPENPLSLISDDQSKVDSMKNTLRGIVATKNDGDRKALDTFIDRLTAFVRDLPTVYQLIPYADMSNAYADGQGLSGMGIVNVDGKAISNYDEFMNFLKERDFVNDRCIQNMVKWQDEQYVEKNGKKVHASTLVDTYYFVGNDLETEVCINYKNGKMIGSTESKLGDGTVPLYSATCGRSLDDEKVIEFKGISHGDLSEKKEVLDVCSEVIKGTWKK